MNKCEKSRILVCKNKREDDLQNTTQKYLFIVGNRQVNISPTLAINQKCKITTNKT